jgi:hypothetical protein
MGASAAICVKLQLTGLASQILTVLFSCYVQKLVVWEST